jgi:hypothetical protein
MSHGEIDVLFHIIFLISTLNQLFPSSRRWIHSRHRTSSTTTSNIQSQISICVLCRVLWAAPWFYESYKYYSQLTGFLTELTVFSSRDEDWEKLLPNLNERTLLCDGRFSRKSRSNYYNHKQTVCIDVISLRAISGTFVEQNFRENMRPRERPENW